MSAATVAVTAGKGRAPLPLNLASIPITVTLATTAYATAAGGVAFDPVALLLAAGANGAQQINDGDVLDFIGWYQDNAGTGRGVLMQFAVGVATYTAQKDASSALPGVGLLTTCPCTVRIYQTGAADAGVMHEIADGNLTGSLKGHLLVTRGGHN